jgi:AbrB family looped-hinge helix DNA binding protein
MRKEARLTSKGQVTIPRDIRRLLGVQTGDRLIFEGDRGEVRMRNATAKSRFAKYQGIGNPGLKSGRRAILKYIRELRGR